MSFQELDEQEFPVTRLDLEIAKKEHEKAQDIDAAEKMQRRIREARTQPTYRKVDTSTETQNLDTEEFPVEGGGAPPPRILRRVGDRVGAVERRIGSVSVGLREKSVELRADPEPPTQVSRKRKQPVKKVDTSVDLQTLDVEAVPVSRPVGMETPTPIRVISGLTLRAGAGFYDALTLPARPTLIGETVTTGVGVIVSHKIQKQVATAIKADPAGFGAELVGGVLGGSVLGKAIKSAGTRIERFRYGETFSEIPDEAFFHPSEEGFRYPRAVDTTRIDVVAKTDAPIQFDIGAPFDPSDFRIRKGMAGGVRAETVQRLQPKIRFITHLQGGVEHLPGVRITSVTPAISGSSSLIRATTLLGGISSLRPEKLRTIAAPRMETAPVVVTAPGIVSPVTTQKPIAAPTITQEPGTIPRMAPPYTGPDWRQFQPVLPDTIQRTYQRKRTLAIQAPRLAATQTSKQRQRIAPIFPTIQRTTLKKSSRIRIPEPKKKGKPGARSISLFAGEFRAYNIKDVLDLI